MCIKFSEEPFHIYWVTKLVYQEVFWYPIFLLNLHFFLEKLGTKKPLGKLILETQ